MSVSRDLELRAEFIRRFMRRIIETSPTDIFAINGIIVPHSSETAHGGVVRHRRRVVCANGDISFYLKFFSHSSIRRKIAKNIYTYIMPSLAEFFYTWLQRDSSKTKRKLFQA